MSTKMIRTAIAAAAAALLLAACSSGDTGGTQPNGSSGAPNPPTSTDILRIGSTDTIDSLNPFVGFQTLAYSTYEITYPYLVTYAEDLSFEPYFATDWSTSPDGKVWTFHTRPGATWSDGEPLDATDVAWTFNTLVKYQDKAAGNWASTVLHLTKVTSPDANTAVFTYEQPVANVLSQLQQVPILPEQFWTKAAPDGKFKSVNMTPPIVSGGPFILQAYDKDSSAVLRANPSYWGEAPHVAGVSVTMYKEDDAMIAAMQNHELDLLERVSASGIKPLEQAGFDIQQAPSPAFSDFIFNSNPKKPKNRELLDPQVREAFAASFDLQTMNDTVWLGTATMGTTIVPPATGSWSDPTLQSATPYDPGHANAILDDLGYAKGSDGVRVADGHRMSYQVIVPDIDNGDRNFELVRGWLAAIGVEVTEKKVDGSTAFDLTTAPDGKYLDFDMSMWTWGMLPDPDFALSVVLCSQYGDWNDTGYCNPAYDKLYAQQGTEVDVDQRQATVYEMQQILAHDRPYIVLGYKNSISAADKTWTGFDYTMYGPYNSLSPTSMINARKG